MPAIYRKLTRSPGARLAVLGLLLSAAIVILFLVDLHGRYRERIAVAKTDAQSFANILAEHALLTFEDVDRLLIEADAIRRDTMSKKDIASGAANAALRQFKKSSRILVAIGWTDEAGNVVAHSYPQELPRQSIAEMFHFQAHRDGKEDRLFIAPPFRLALSDKWLTAASRRMSNPNGSFAGIMAAAIDQSYFNKLYRSIDLGKEGSIALLHREGRLLAREPENQNAVGKSVAAGPLFTKYLPAAATGAYEMVSPIDGLARIAGYKAVSGLPLVVMVTYARGEILKPWFQHLYTFGLLVIAVVIFILFGTFMLMRQANALAKNSRALAKTNARFDAALSNMPHGLSMFDSGERLLVSNNHYREMYRLTEEQVRPGTPLSQILHDFGGRREEIHFQYNSFFEGAKERTPHALRLADGRTILIVRTPMEDGGWVATHEDVTEKRRAEAMLVANADELKRANERFDVATSNMSQGLCLFDADKKLVISNRRYQDMYGLPDELVAPGTPLRVILQHYADRGETGTLSVDGYTQAMPTEAQQIYELADGRRVLIQRQTLLDGGWVATHTDITEQQRGERLLAEKAAELNRINVQFDAAINNMSQGLCMFDAEQKIVVSNARYGEIYRLSLEQIKPGTTLRQVLECRCGQGTHFMVAPELYVSANVKLANEVQELADGRFVSIARHPMPGGGWLTTHEDITDRALNEKRIAFLAQHDLLTGLANRVLFVEKLDEAAKRLKRHGTTFTILMLDLDRFKHVNDTLGHPAGDQLLVEVAERLSSSLRETDVLARLGGDEFAIIQENEKNQHEGAIALALKIIALIEQPFDLNGHRASIGTSIGIAFAPEHGTEPEMLLKRADLALYAAKSAGRNDFRVFEPELMAAEDHQMKMEIELQEALAENQFELHYQPVVDIRSGRIHGMEAFVRWHHPSSGLLTPGQFLPAAESGGLLVPLSEWILQQACTDAATWPAHVVLALNISAVQFRKENVFEVILCALVDSGLAPERLEIEIADVDKLDVDRIRHLQTIRQLKNIGVSIVLDDCGSDHSSASYLTAFPFDNVKINKPFTQGIVSRRDCAAVVTSVVALARGLDVTTTAKGVETVEQLEALRAAGIDRAQGFLFGRAAAQFELDFDAAIMPVAARNVA